VRVTQTLPLIQINSHDMKTQHLLFSLNLFIAALSCITGSSVKAQTYGNVAMGGGGFVSGIITSKIDPNLIYARTDVGGAYRWDNTNSKWIPLLDWSSSSETGYLGVESLATDPINANNLYMLVGISYFNSGKTAILRSQDKGNTFSITDVTSQFKADGNGMGRQNGEKLQVDPNNNTILYCGTRANGLFKSTNSGVSWSRLSGLNITTTSNGAGLSFILLDKTLVSGGVTQRIFVGVSQTGTNFYISTNAGASFTAVSGGPTTLMPQRAALASDGNLYITYADHEGPWNPTTGQVWKYNVSSGAWTNVTPAGITFPFSGISVDPYNPTRLMLSTINTYYSQGSAWGDQFYISYNGGSTWTNVVARGFTLNNQGVPWLTSSQSIHWAGCIEFDPFSTGKVWVTSGNGIFRNDSIETSNNWKAMVKGMEETVPQDMISIPGGPIFSAISDYDGFKQTAPATYGTQNSPTMGSNSGITYASKSTSKLARVGTLMYYSTNQGTSWTQTSAMPPANGSTASNFGYAALSSSGGRILYSPANGNNTTMYYSTNNGGSWSTVNGISFNTRPVSDYETDNRFFTYNQADGYLYYSTNGTSFSKGAYTGASYGSFHIRTVPGNSQHVWVALYGNGLAYTTNGSNSSVAFTKITTVTTCSAVGIGATASGATYPTIYIWGTVGGVEGLFRSTNKGASWTRINDNLHEWGGVGNGQFVIGDMNTYGRVYMSTAGRGIAYIESSSVARLSSPTDTTSKDASLLKVSAFPNPVTDQLNVRLTEDLKGGTIYLFNSSGLLVFAGKANATLATIDMTTLPSGIYLLKIDNGIKSAVIKIVKR
jgi:hypothetical protein